MNFCVHFSLEAGLDAARSETTVAGLELVLYSYVTGDVYKFIYPYYMTSRGEGTCRKYGFTDSIFD